MVPGVVVPGVVVPGALVSGDSFPEGLVFCAGSAVPFCAVQPIIKIAAARTVIQMNIILFTLSITVSLLPLKRTALSPERCRRSF